jgi:hypothetical protein
VLLTQKEEEKKKKRKKGFKIAYSSLLPQLLSITKQIIHAKEPIEEIHQNKPLSSSLLSFFRPLTRNSDIFFINWVLLNTILSSPCKTR